VWTFSGPVPPGAATIVINTYNDTTYAIPCDGDRWTLALASGDLPGALTIQAAAIDGTPLVREATLLSPEHLRKPSRSRWPRRSFRRGWTTYGPGSR